MTAADAWGAIGNALDALDAVLPTERGDAHKALGDLAHALGDLEDAALGDHTEDNQRWFGRLAELASVTEAGDADGLRLLRRARFLEDEASLAACFGYPDPEDREPTRYAADDAWNRLVEWLDERRRGGAR